MNIGALVRQMTYNKPLIRFDAGNSPLETYKGVFNESQDLYSDLDFTYYINLIHLFDRAIIEDNLHTLSIEQQKLLERYFLKGHPYSKMCNETPNEELALLDLNVDESIKHQTTPLDVLKFHNFDLPRDIELLDHFLGSFVGVEHGPYSRYGKKQFYRQRKPFSETIEPINRA